MIKKDHSLNIDERNTFIGDVHSVISVVLFCLFALLLISVLWLVSRLRKRRDQVPENERAKLSKEIYRLWLILGIYAITTLCRAVWDVTMNVYYEKYWSMVGIMLMSLLWDFLPVISLLIFHFRNFRMTDKQMINLGETIGFAESPNDLLSEITPL